MTEAERKIRERAERLWREAGEPQGRDDEFWEKAEREIEAEDNDPRPQAPGRR